MNRVVVIILTLFRSGIIGLRSASGTALISAATIGIALFLVGAFALAIVNMEGVQERFSQKLSVTAYLENDVDDESALQIAERVATVEGVEQVAVVGRDEALERFRRMAGGASLLEGLEENPLPASLEITLVDLSRTPEGLGILAGALDGLPGIGQVADGREWIDGYARVTSLVRVSGLAIGTILSLATLLIVANTIRLGIYAREDELEILALVGASRTFVRTPFLIEGTLQGILGGVWSAVILWLAYLLLMPQLEYGLTFLLGNAQPRFFHGGELLVLIASGAVLGLLGSLASLLGWRR
ncbi:MAG: hypothetical protein CBC48_09305 [bacterium TMED88]|nr:hypothetical protein [Deltaproteobacteria bacterium]OUV31762.1 MAG: hypothetical protein CBC48_09305 [bacterium TMED88]